jgi:PKD repeat protein
LQNPTGITYPTTGGCYSVSLTVSNACGSNTLTRPCFVNIGQPTACDKLFISEYIEGSGQNKAIEIYNAGSATATLSGYSVVTVAQHQHTP